MVLQVNGIRATPLGLYFHVPFCPTACDFCAFYQESPTRGDVERFLCGIEHEIGLYSWDREVSTVFWGGGTPGVLTSRDLFRMGSAMLRRLGGAPREWTVELAPSTVKEDKLACLRELGVTRLSLGVQSFDDHLLKRMGRRQSSRQAMRAIESIHQAGFGSFNLDLIFAVPGQTLESWDGDLKTAISFEPQHVSTYCLTVEEDTALYLQLCRGEFVKPSEDHEIACYERSIDLLAAAGYHQYEISNFAKTGHACAHNINTWRMGDWIGLGPSAASQIEGRRYTNIASLGQWFDGVARGEPQRCEQVRLTPETLAADRLVFGLRMNCGLRLMDVEAEYPQADLTRLRRVLRELERTGFVSMCQGEDVRLTRRGRLVADAIALRIMDALET